VVARLASRIGKLERAIRPAEPGCDRCRGHRILGIGEFTEWEEGGRVRRACAACGNDLTECKVIMLDLREVI
jgi:hypothetical protein